jgi:predicted Rossmann fold nucleotide-binding protein DprA/Smf involved in DNA uptake
MNRPSWITPPIEEALPLWGAARATDPATSHEAARRAPVAGHCRLIWEALAAGPAGQTELARRTGMTVAAVSKRLPDMRRAGLIEQVGETVSASGGREAKYAATVR